MHLGALADAGTANTTQSAITKTVVEPSTRNRSCMNTTLKLPKEPMPAAAHAYPLRKNLAAGRRRFSVVQLFQTSFKFFLVIISANVHSLNFYHKSIHMFLE